MNIWNEINLKKPPLNTISNQNLSQDDLRNLKNILTNALLFYENQTEFEQSAALCSRLIARRKNSFKKLYGFKTFTKLNSALCRLLKVDIKNNLQNFLGIMPEFISSNITKNQVPTKINFEYLLYKIIALHKLHERISFCAKETAEYFRKLLYHNYFFDTLTLFLATVSNLWKISNQIGIYTSELYTKILLYRKDFPLGSNHVLAHHEDDFIFPKILNSSIFESINKDENKDIEKNTAHIQIVLNNVDEQKSSDIINDEKFINLTDDIQMVVNKNSKMNCNINEIKTTEQIQKFIQQENKERKKNLKKCITRKISEIYWKKSIKDILNKINLNHSKNAIKSFKYLIKNKI